MHQTNQNGRGCLPFRVEFEWAVEFMAKQRINVSPPLTGARRRNVHTEVKIKH